MAQSQQFPQKCKTPGPQLPSVGLSPDVRPGSGQTPMQLNPIPIFWTVTNRSRMPAVVMTQLGAEETQQSRYLTR